MIEVRHRLGSYPVQFQGIQTALEQLTEEAFVITDSTVAGLYKPPCPAFVVEPGEQSKSLSTYAEAHSWLASQRAKRSSIVAALGGGVVGDLAGFVAATYMRGVSLWQIPTTLLAQVDSSVGGKVGVDLPEGKNLVGAFYPPSKVIVPLDALATLDDQQFTNGMAEVWKYAFALDREMVAVLERYPLRQDAEHLQNIVERCIWLKAEVVEQDEFERTGLRAVLNFGHTVGHALEKLAGYQGMLHGEAISVGMVAETLLGERMGITAPGTLELVESHLTRQGLPTRDARLMDVERVLAAIRSDKKATAEGLAFSLLTQVGECKLVNAVPEELVRRTLQEL